MTWHTYKPVFTVADLIESGACVDGVIAAVKQHKGRIAAATKYHITNPYVTKTTAANGYGDGSGSGYGYGYGNGSG